MLDRGNPERKVDALRDQYRELSDAHAAIQRAAKQLKILKPLVDAASEYRDYEARIARYEEAKNLIPFYIAEKAQNLLQSAIQNNESQQQAQQGRLNTVNETLKTLRSDLERVNISIAQDDVGRAKREIEGKIPLLKETVRARQRSAGQYDEFAKSLEMQVYTDEEVFYENIASAKMMFQDAENQIETLESERSQTDYELRDIREQATGHESEIQYLRDNLSNIPAQVARIREVISLELNLSLDQLPFVGELLRVRDGEAQWEGTIERLLHSFAQDLIVPENVYQQVSRFVNENNLRGRLVYHRVDPHRRLKRLPEKREQLVEGQMIYEKLDIKENTPFNDWLIAKLTSRFDYVCCATLADFQQAKRAITPNGQIKHDTARHEKDDRRKIDDRRHYVLGWDNRDKLKQLETELVGFQKNIRDLETQISDITTMLKRRRTNIQNLKNLLRFEDFTEIDWRNRQSELDRLQHELQQLNQQSQQLQRLEAQRDDFQRQIDETESERTKIIGRISTFDNMLSSLRQKLDRADNTLRGWNVQHQKLSEQVGEVLVDIDREKLTIENLDRRPNELAISIQGSITSFKGYQTQHRSVILDSMHLFRREYADEGASLTPEIESLLAFETIFNRLETDDLPQYEERFKQMLDRHVASSIQDFIAQLDKQERDIDRSIEELNISLSQIDYGGNSTIRLIAETAPDPEIRDFRNQLRACIPNYDDSREALDRTFRRIQELIERFNEDPNWMRRVIDVRRWRIFAAEQIDVNGNQLDYYNDSSGKSGGQKAKLAYTILASAIAYQYGLQDEMVRERTFRFVVVDEAFSKLDDDNARFAMQLFKQLGLQLLVVTPMQQLHVIEDYVKAYHIVVNNDEGSHSRVFNLTQNEYKERRREVLRAYLSDEAYFPMRFPVGKPTENLVERRNFIQALRDNASQDGEDGYHIEWKTVNKRDLGEQTIPTHIVIGSIDDYLAIIRKKTEFDNFTTNVVKIRAKFPQLEEWMHQYSHHIIEYDDIWDDLLAVCHHFTLNPRPNVYIRELPISVHTKFIERHTRILRDLLNVVLPDSAIDRDASDFPQRFGLRDKPSLVRMRLLDEQLDWQYTIKIDDISLPVDQLAHLLNKHIQPRYIIIVENLINFLTVPHHPGTVALFGGGFAVHILKDVDWLNQSNIVYWGDIDAHGFQILSDFRGIFSHTRSVLMDRATLDANVRFTVQDNQNRADRFTNLHESERELLDYIWQHQLRLEQEHIPHQYAVEKIKRVLLGNS